MGLFKSFDLLERIGPERFSAHLRNAGLRLRMQQGAVPNLSLILGGGGTTLEELVGAYTALGREGVAGRPRLSPARSRKEGAYSKGFLGIQGFSQSRNID